MMMEPMGWNVGMLLSMSVVSLAVLAALIAGIVVLARAIPRRDGGSDARAILDERFARGDIDLEAYEERRRLLR